MASPTKEDLRREISQILQGADLSALSSKKVRLKLQEIFDVNLADRKKEIDQILMALIAESQTATAAKEKGEQEDVAQTSAGPVSKKRHKRRSDSSSDELRDSSPPVKKKKKKKKESSKQATKHKEKKEKSPRKKEAKSSKKKEAPKSQSNVHEDDSDDEHDKQGCETINDEELAWKLHQEESRRTRNHSTRKAAVKTKPTSRKENGASKDKAKTGYVADMILSPQLASIIGEDRMSRHEVVKRMWGIIKDRDLMDPRNKQFHICDDELLQVFGQRRIRTFSMMKYLKSHIKDPRNLTTQV